MAQFNTLQSFGLSQCFGKLLSYAATSSCPKPQITSQLRLQSSSLSACTRHISTSLCRRDERFEPPYLNDKIPKVGTYPLINIQMKGYDFPVLQSYQSWVHRALCNMGLQVSDAWAVPCQALEVTRMQKQKKDTVDEVFKLKIYERTVQVSSLPCTDVPVMLEVLQAALPQGVDLYVDHHTKEVEANRYVPNRELKELRKQIYDIENPTEIKNTFRRR